MDTRDLEILEARNYSKEFHIPDYDEVMSETKGLSNAELMKNMMNITKLTQIKYNKDKDMLNPPLIKDAPYYNFYVLNVVNNVKDLPRTFLGEAIKTKLQSPYTHTFISLDIHMTSALGMLTQGLVRELPEFYGLQTFKFKFKRDYDVFVYKILPDEYKKARKLFTNMMLNMEKYTYDFLGLAKPLIYKLDSNKIPVGNDKAKQREMEIESYHKKTSFICSTFALYMLSMTSQSVNTWYHEKVQKDNLITSCFNPASIVNIPGMTKIFNVPPSAKLEDIVANYLKKHPDTPN